MSCAASILVIDPVDTVRAIAGRMLATRLYEVKTVSTGIAAISLLESGAKPDVILTEVCMSGLCGNDLLASFRRAAPGASIIAMSGYVQEPLDPPLQLLVKPFTLTQLLVLVAAALDEAHRLLADAESAHQELRSAVGESQASRLRSRELRERRQRDAALRRGSDWA
jgi:DNA-binding NtrC family response regulator